MAKPDRAARVAAGIAGRNLMCDRSQRAVAAAIRREVKRAVEEEREACAQIVMIEVVRGDLVAAKIRARK